MASIQKRPDGRYRARYRDAAGKEHARHFPRQREAKAWLDEVTATVVTGTYVDPQQARTTFDDYFREWAARQVWAPMTEVQADLVRRTVTFGDVPMGRLRRSHLEAWVKKMTSDGYAPTTVSTRMSTVRAALRAAVGDRVIASDPSVGVKLPRARRAAAAMQIPTVEQVGALISASEPRMAAFVALCAFAGLRLGEASAVKVEDVDFLRRRLEVRRQVQRARGGPAEIRAPKYESERVVYLPDTLVQMLAVHVEQHGVAADGWLFFGGDGRPIAPSTTNDWWQRTVKAAGTPGLHIHGLRHFYASGLIAAGCDVVTVQRALGHANATTTLNTYSHLWPTAEDRTRQAAEAMLSAAIGHPADAVRTKEA